VRWLGAPEEVPSFLGVARRRGTVDLPALAPGGYRLIATAEVADKRGAGEATFNVPPAVPGTPAALPRDTFALASEARLDSMYGPLLYLMMASERGVYPALSLAERRAFLRAFWAARDPTPGTPRNEALEDFYGRVREVNRRFREGGAAEIPGWRTDRGRIYIRNGPPDAVLSRPQPGWTNPYEAWTYSRGRERVYVFFDLTRFGNYALIWTNDRLDTGLPNWRELLGREALDDISRFAPGPRPMDRDSFPLR
jgi:GWxTD domain-containing protein